MGMTYDELTTYGRLRKCKTQLIYPVTVPRLKVYPI